MKAKFGFSNKRSLFGFILENDTKLFPVPKECG